jgi:hypothetical protein
MLFPLSMLQIPGFEGSIALNGRSHTLVVPVVHRQPALSIALATEVLGAGGAPRGIVGTEMSGASIPGSVAPGGASSALGSSGTMLPELHRPYPPSSSDSASSLVNWKRVESKAELAWSQVTIAGRLLHQILASVNHNILHLVQVSLGKKTKKIPPPPQSPTASSMLTCFFASSPIASISW